MPPDRQLPRHVRFARSLALVSGAAVGLAVGVALVGPAGCGSCNGICGYVPPPVDAAPKDSTTTDTAGDAADAVPDAGASGGGPPAAPPLPASWSA